MLPPAGTSPHVLACVIKLFLLTLPEPLLTYKCAVGSTLNPHGPSSCCTGCWLKRLLRRPPSIMLSGEWVIPLPACIFKRSLPPFISHVERSTCNTTPCLYSSASG